MTMLSDEELLNYNRKGLIPGPSESEAEFIKRAEHCLNLKEQLIANLGQQVASEMDNEVATKLLAEARPDTLELFDFAPTWIPILFSNTRLTPWHGGCAWIFQFSDETPVAAFFQLRRVFISVSNYLWIYDRDEIIAHESAHVGRMVFQEPKFEEILAYRTARSRFRRWFGPIVQAPWEATLFIFLLFLVFFVDFYFMLFEPAQIDKYASSLVWLKIPPLILLGAGLARLWWRQRRFLRCYQLLQEVLKERIKANAVIYRLQDHEIIRFAKMTPAQILDYVAAQRCHSLRWRVIGMAYFD